MEHAPLGRTGMPVSRISLGTMTFGFQCDEATSVQIMDKALELGITFLDTSDIYPLADDKTTLGASEEIMGRWLKRHRDDVILATKCGIPMGTNPWNQGGSRKHIVEAVDASLRRLQTDYIDLYMQHRFDPSTPAEETLRAMDDLVHSGKVRYIGVSNSLAYQLARALGTSDVLRVARYQSVQTRYNLLFRAIERELVPLCREEQISITPYNPLAGGLLTGKHSASGPAEGTRFTHGAFAPTIYKTRYWQDDKLEVVDRMRPLAERAGIPMGQMAIAWVLSNPAVTSAICGASRADQLELAAAAADTKLDDDLLTQLDELTRHYRQDEEFGSFIDKRKS